jgi:intracellular sulfur oxidation DsrE/DsrF family protein
MILNGPNMWDAAAVDTVLAYTGGPKQAWDNTDLLGPWLKEMRNSMNTQIWSFKEPNFLCVSATHGSAHLALLDQQMWNKYQLAKLVGRGDGRNTFILTPSTFSHDTAVSEFADRAVFLNEDSVVILQQRGVVFMACHNAIWELAQRLVKAGQNPDHLEIDSMAAELTNHLIADVVLTPGVVATLVKLQSSGFAYSR